MPLRVAVSDRRGRPARAPGVAAWLRRVAPARAEGEVTIVLVTDRRMRQLNRTFRRKDYATDVLTFPCDSELPVSGGRPPVASRRFLGDIVIAQGVARRQARARGHSLAVELRVLSLHGLLHLLGYDHERDNGQMRRLEQRLRRKGGVREGLIERA